MPSLTVFFVYSLLSSYLHLVKSPDAIARYRTYLTDRHKGTTWEGRIMRQSAMLTFVTHPVIICLSCSMLVFVLLTMSCCACVLWWFCGQFRFLDVHYRSQGGSGAVQEHPLGPPD